MSETEERLARLEALVAAATAGSIEQAAELAEQLARRPAELCNARAARRLELSLRLAVQARDFFRGLEALLEARAGQYTAEGALRLPESHRLALEA
jgi:outer membrane PBP1 activator LpoA protein